MEDLPQQSVTCPLHVITLTFSARIVIANTLITTDLNILFAS